MNTKSILIKEIDNLPEAVTAEVPDQVKDLITKAS
jgi:hypothetical protein